MRWKWAHGAALLAALVLANLSSCACALDVQDDDHTMSGLQPPPSLLWLPQNNEHSSSSSSASSSSTTESLKGSNLTGREDSTGTLWSRTGRRLLSGTTFMRMSLLLLAVYCMTVIALMTSRYAQSFLIYLNFIAPPRVLFPLTDLVRYRLSNLGRNVRVDHLRGWHLLPPGPPFISDARNHQNEAYFLARLAQPHQRVVVFFHGNSGTRAFPPKRLHLLKLLNANLRAHVLTFDYTGFADSLPTSAPRTQPSEAQMYADADAVLRYIYEHIDARTSSVFVYGQSLGTFAATHVAMRPAGPLTGVVLDAPPASLHHAALTHPAVAPFRLLGLTRLFPRVIKERHSNLACIKHCSAPLLILHGSRDAMIPCVQGELLADACEQAGNTDVTYVAFEDVGHVDVSGADLYLHTLWCFMKKTEHQSKSGFYRTER